MVFVCIVIIISVAFVFTYPFLRIASDCDRQMEEMMKKAEKRKEEISESPKLPGCWCIRAFLLR